jgi:ribonuclease-3
MNTRAAAATELERSLGHAFTDPRRLELALTHASVGGAARVKDNERYEFLGDRVLGLLVAERLMELYPDLPEGKLTPRFHGLVDKPACARAARAMGIGPALRLSPGESKTGGRDKETVLADACEAVMAAVYLDGGLDAARGVFRRFWDEQIEHQAGPAARDPKSALQAWAQGQGKPVPAYQVVTRSGPDHAPRFTVEVSVEGVKPLTAQGTSRQAAEKAAAADMLKREGLL